jgi:hypothetical protein
MQSCVSYKSTFESSKHDTAYPLSWDNMFPPKFLTNVLHMNVPNVFNINYLQISNPVRALHGEEHDHAARNWAPFQ